MQSRFAIVLMSVAGAALLFSAGMLFGLGVVSSPNGEQHKAIAVTNEPVKVARRETTGSGDPGRPLTPLTPVHPGVSEQTAKAAEPQTPSPTPAPAPVAQAPAQPAPVPAQTAADVQKPADPAPKEAKTTPATPPAPAKAASAEKPAGAPANATPVSLHAKTSCDVQACARAYKSFRESDCTYQPYSGPRQLCVSPPGAKEASRETVAHTTPVRVHRGVRQVDVEDVPREAARTDGASSGDEDARPARRDFHRDYTADGEDDGIDDSRVIVRRGDYDRGYDDGGWHRRFFAPVEVDDDDQ